MANHLMAGTTPADIAARAGGRPADPAEAGRMTIGIPVIRRRHVPVG